MRIQDFPKNDEIKDIEKAIISLKKTNSWGAVMLAKTDLDYLLSKREEWLSDKSK